MLDVIIIGSGPAGLSAAIYAVRANLQVLVVEKEYMGTGQVAESGRVDNYLGLNGLEGYDLGERFRKHAEELGVEFQEGEAVFFEKYGQNWKIQLDTGEIIEARAVIYAAGAFHRRLGLPEETAFAGKGISYCAVCDGALYQDKTVAVIGGGDTALDDASYLSGICQKVYLIHRRREFRGSAGTLQKLQATENVEIITEAQAIGIAGAKRVEELRLDNGRRLEVQGIFIAVGMIPSTDKIKDLVELDGQGYVVADESGKTCAEGFFAAGDIRTKPLRQIVTAAADGANAAMSAREYVSHME